MIQLLKAQVHYWRWCYYDWRYGRIIDTAARLVCPLCRTDIEVKYGGQAGVVAVVPCWRCWL